MNRWTHALHRDDGKKLMRELQNLIDSLDVRELDESVKFELQRLKKITGHISFIMSSIDPDVTPLPQLRQSRRDLEELINVLRDYRNNPRDELISRSNDYADNIVQALKPYVVDSAINARAIIRAVQNYYRELAASVNEDRLSVRRASDSATALIEEMEGALHRIKEFESTLFDDAKQQSFQSKMVTLNLEVEKIYSEIKAYNNTLFESTETSESVKSRVASLLRTIGDQATQINDDRTKIDEIIGGLKAYYYMVFGREDGDGNCSSGLKGEVELRQAQLEDLYKHHQEQYSAIKSEIEGLLPGATSAGLATAFRVVHRSLSRHIKAYNKVFYWSIGTLTVIALLTVIKEFGMWHISFVNVSDLKELSSNIIYKMPLAAPVIWLAYYAASRRSEYVRLQQEYIHKEVIAKSYHGYKVQVEQLNIDDRELMRKLLDSAITAVSKNASETLDNVRKVETPISDGLEECLKRMKELKELFKKD